MAKEIRVPALGESVTEATIAKWFRQAGETVKADEPLVELETDKVTVEVPAPASGKLAFIDAAPGTTVNVGALLGRIEEGVAGAAPAKAVEAAAPKKAEPAAAAKSDAPLSPAVRKMVDENKVDTASVSGSGKDGRITKGDVIAHLEKPAVAEVKPLVIPAAPVAAPRAALSPGDGLREERVKMSRLRLTIARRLKDAQNTAAMLTTFNEVDMTAAMALRNQYKEVFEKKHGVKLGFMSFFVKACIAALKEIPAVNAEIDGDDIVYKNFYHIGVAVGTDKGLVVPVLRDADLLSFAGVEKTIAEYGKRARDGQLQIADNGQVAIRPMMYLALSYDHRIVDGKEAVTFLVRVKENLEDPQRAILDL